MKKSCSLLLCALLLLGFLPVLSACSNQASPSIPEEPAAVEPESEAESEADDGPSAMAAAYEAISADESLAGLVEYYAEDDRLYVMSDLSSEQLSSILSIAEPFVESEPFRIDIGKSYTIKDPSETKGSREGFYSQLAAMKCSSMDLALATRTQSEFDLLSGIPTLTALTNNKQDADLTYPAMPALRQLTIFADSVSVSFDGLEASSGLEELTIIAFDGNPKFDFPNFTALTSLGSFADVYTLGELPNLQSVSFKTTSGRYLDELRGATEESEETLKNTGYAPFVTMAVICDIVRTMPSLESLNGQDPSTYDPTAGFTDEQKQMFEEYRASEFAKSVYAGFREGAYAEGPADITGPAIVWCVTDNIPYEMASSPASSAAGESYQGMSQDWFTTDPRACTQVVLVYADYENDGNYYSSIGTIAGEAYKTHTQVVVVDVANGTASAPYTAATADPPETTTSTTDSGVFLPEEALPYIRGLF